MLESDTLSQYVPHPSSRRAIEMAADIQTTYARDGMPTHGKTFACTQQ
jgi:hypothetical protein